LSFKPVLDGQKKLNSRTIKQFWGSDYSSGRTDQPNNFAYVCDCDCKDEMLELRPGMRKNETTGFSSTMEGLFFTEFAGRILVGRIYGGALDILDAADVIDGS